MLLVGRHVSRPDTETTVWIRSVTYIHRKLALGFSLSPVILGLSLPCFHFKSCVIQVLPPSCTHEIFTSYAFPFTASKSTRFSPSKSSRFCMWSLKELNCSLMQVFPTYHRMLVLAGFPATVDQRLSACSGKSRTY